MLDQARKVGQELPLLSVHADVLEACRRHGEGEQDNSIVIEEDSEAYSLSSMSSGTVQWAI